MSKEKKVVTPTAEEMAEFGGEAETSPPPAQSDGQGQETASAAPRSEADEWKDKYLRARAELANYQKRAEKDRAESLRYAVAEFARSLIPILDNLDRVMKAASAGEPTVQSLLEGVKLTRDSFLKALGEFNVQPIDAEGRPFDPLLHEALMERASDEHEERTVLQELEKGYRLHDRILRPARVVVSKRSEQNSSREDGR